MRWPRPSFAGLTFGRVEPGFDCRLRSGVVPWMSPMKNVARLSLAAVTLAGALGATAATFDPRETFAPFTYPQPVNAYRSGSGLPGPLFWQNRADYDLAATLDPVREHHDGQGDHPLHEQQPGRAGRALAATGRKPLHGRCPWQFHLGQGGETPYRRLSNRLGDGGAGWQGGHRELCRQRYAHAGEAAGGRAGAWRQGLVDDRIFLRPAWRLRWPQGLRAVEERQHLRDGPVVSAHVRLRRPARLGLRRRTSTASSTWSTAISTTPSPCLRT